jgi:hypothetical protein
MKDRIGREATANGDFCVAFTEAGLIYVELIHAPTHSGEAETFRFYIPYSVPVLFSNLLYKNNAYGLKKT